MTEQVIHDNSEDEPVVYCAECYSLKIVHEDSIDSDCCMECGCTTVREAPFEEWEKLYEKRYGKKFTVKSEDHSRSPIFTMPLNKLKTKVYNSPKWETIIKEIYGCLPKGLSKIDAILVFFDKLIKDNKLNNLRELLYKMKI